ncbi:MAG: hypothetical protein NW226_22145 [Microscillaceae bacterium]|nr:hypothetical protein [Microscillaceae bacterium]
MKKLLQHIGIYALTINILLASIGVPLHTRSCEMPDMEDVSRLFSPPEMCFADLKKDHGKETNPCKKTTDPSHQPIDPCCDFSSVLLNVDFLSLELESQTLKTSPVCLIATLPSFESYHLLKFYSTELLIICANSPPPLSGRNIILRKQSFLI